MTADDYAPDLGPCCACGKAGPSVRNLLSLGQKSPTPGRGWGCFLCHLPLDGALAVVCDACLEADATLVWACRGYPASDGRVPIGELDGKHEHDLRYHRLQVIRCRFCGGEHQVERAKESETEVLFYRCERLSFADLAVIEGRFVAGLPAAAAEGL